MISSLWQGLREILSQRRRQTLTNTGLSQAAVLIPICQKEGEYYILFTKRTQKVEYHKGQLSFPGGARERGDKNLMVTALRESFEEIGLRPEDAEVWGGLDEVRTITSRFAIAPFVAAIPYPYSFRINSEEVEELIGVPISALLKQEVSPEQLIGDGGELLTSYFYHYKDHIIWGATARILKQLLDLISDCLPQKL
jgi:8-oxo-dGTP pyrophosphatase MutT (NUDIX family)